VTSFRVIGTQLPQCSNQFRNFVHQNHTDGLELSKAHEVLGSCFSDKSATMELTDNEAAVAFEDTGNLPAPCREPLEVTTLHSSGCKAPELANHILNFFWTTQHFQVTKITKLKFSIKAAARMGTLELKIRIYDEQDRMDNVGNKYAIEFQRRSGDSIQFMNSYREAATYLKNHCLVTLKDPPHSPRYPLSAPSTC